VNSTIKVELFEEHNKANYYSIIIDDANSEFEKFLNKFSPSCECNEDINIITQWIDHIGENGALERYFRPEGGAYDNLCAIPLDICKLRVFVLRISDKIVILGNGDKKTTKKYQDDSKLNEYAETLQWIDKNLKKRIVDKSVTIRNKELNGNLKFE
jgi:hypothetical protein